MTLYYSHPASLDHRTGAHPENPERIRALEAALEGADYRLERLESPRASSEQLERVHAPAHIGAIEEFCAAGGGMIDIDTAASPGSWEAALRAAGAACDAVDRLLAGEAPAAFCGLRPPGHHAERDRAMGFASSTTLPWPPGTRSSAAGAERVLILDWDVHHGNGTEEIFKASNQVLYASIHQWPLYPGTGAADYEGEGGGGFTINLPVAPGADSERFRALVDHVVAPVARAFRPGLIAISAGFDAHRSDPLASCLVEEEGYWQMAATMRGVALGPRRPRAGLPGAVTTPARSPPPYCNARGARGRRGPSLPRPSLPSHRARVAGRWGL